VTLHRYSLHIRVLVATLVASGVARAEEKVEVPDETIFVIDDRPDSGVRDRERLLGDAPFVTVLHADDHGATTSVAEALATTAGVQGRSLGGLGASQTISVRGQTPTSGGSRSTASARSSSIAARFPSSSAARVLVARST
jgi:hypothetical protein